MEIELDFLLEDLRHAEQRAKKAELDVKHAEQVEEARQEVRQAKQRAAQAKLGVKRAKLRHQQLVLETKQLTLKTKQLQLLTKQARQQVEPSSLSVYLEECHKRSLAISFQTNMSKTYHGSIDPFGRLRPKRIIPWGAFPTFQLTHLLSVHLSQDRENGFEQLHIFCRTDSILKATTNEQPPSLDVEIKAYQLLESLQGKSVPVLIGDFAPQVQHWYHGQQMAHILILS